MLALDLFPSLFSFSSHSQFPAASEREHPHPIFPSEGGGSFILLSQYVLQTFIHSTEIHSAHCVGYLRYNCQQSRRSLRTGGWSCARDTVGKQQVQYSVLVGGWAEKHAHPERDKLIET